MSCDTESNDPKPSEAVNEFQFNGQVFTITQSVTTNFGLEGFQYNLDLELMNGVGVTDPNISYHAYWELLTDDSTRIVPATYNFDPFWSENTFRNAEFYFETPADTFYLVAIGGSLTVNSSSANSIHCHFNVGVVDEDNPSITGIVTGNYNGSGQVNMTYIPKD